MRDRLPPIHINVTDSPRFLEEFTGIAKTLKSLTVTRRAGDNYPVSLRWVDESPVNNCSVHCTIETIARIYVAVTISGDDFSYENYCAVARTIIEPPLAIYNCKMHTRYHIKITPKANLELKLSPHSAKVFKYFTETANKSNLHLSDWRRFYVFTRACRKNLSADDLAFLLVRDGFSEEYAWSIVAIYEHLCDFQRPQNAFERYQYYSVVGGLTLPQDIFPQAPPEQCFEATRSPAPCSAKLDRPAPSRRKADAR